MFIFFILGCLILSYLFNLSFVCMFLHSIYGLFLHFKLSVSILPYSVCFFILGCLILLLYYVCFFILGCQSITINIVPNNTYDSIIFSKKIIHFLKNPERNKAPTRLCSPHFSTYPTYFFD